MIDLANLWKEFRALAPEAEAVDLDEASGTAALQMRDGMELLAEWDEHSLWLSALLGTPHPHHALEVYETLLAFVANPREKGGLIVAGGGGGEPLMVTAPVPGVQTLAAGDLAHAVALFTEIAAGLKRYVAAPDAHHFGSGSGEPRTSASASHRAAPLVRPSYCP